MRYCEARYLEVAIGLTAMRGEVSKDWRSEVMMGGCEMKQGVRFIEESDAKAVGL
jgi:hypothetical protein